MINISDGAVARYGQRGAEIPGNYQLLIAFEVDSVLAFGVIMYGFIYA